MTRPLTPRESGMCEATDRALLLDGCHIVLSGTIGDACGAARIALLCGSASVGDVSGSARVGSVCGSASVERWLSTATPPAGWVVDNGLLRGATA